MPSADEPNAPLHTDGAEAPARESMSLKRGREGSVDLLAETPSVLPIVAKKNRIEEETAADNTDEASTPVNPECEAEESVSGAGTQAKEGRTVGEVRKKVEEMTWKEGENQDVTTAAAEVETADIAAKDDADIDSASAIDSTSAQADKTDSVSDTDSQGLKRKAKDEGENGAASDEKKHKSTSPAPAEPSTSTLASTSTEAVKKPQATFGSFSAKASPFAATAGASPFGALASSSSPFGAAAKSSSPFGAAATSSSSAFGSAASKPDSSSGFGSYSNAFSTFAKKSTEQEAAGPSTSFGEILKERGEEIEETKLQLDKQDVPTGEEDEVTVYQTRVKLYALDGNGGWKERGVGSLKLNKSREDGSGARLVMRAEGVLRVILNCFLYAGMNCLRDGKHLRMTVFEGTELRHMTIRTSSPKIAIELITAIYDHIPLESRKTSPVKAAEDSKSQEPEARSEGAEPKTDETPDAPAKKTEPQAESKADAVEPAEAAVGGEGADEKV